MRALILAAVFALSAGAALAQHRELSNATALCRAGTWSTNTTKQACKHHGGVERWIRRARR